MDTSPRTHNPRDIMFASWSKNWTMDDYAIECAINFKNDWKQMLGRLRNFATDPSQESLGLITRSEAQHALRQASLFESEYHRSKGAKNIDDRLKREQEQAAHDRKKDSQRLRALRK